MANFRYQLEKGPRKFTCPQCGGAKRYRRVIDSYTSNYLPFEVGVCDRVNNCGYEYTWAQYFRENPSIGGGLDNKIGETTIGRSVSRHSNSKRAYLGMEHLYATLRNYPQNTFVQFLLNLLPAENPAVWKAVQKYGIGTLQGFTVFPTINNAGLLCKGKLMKFNVETGKRLKNTYAISSLEAHLKRANKLVNDFDTDKDVFFGEHITMQCPNLPVGVVEAEKTAVLASIFFPKFVWIATGSKQWLKAPRLERLGIERRTILFPDADGFDKWSETAVRARGLGLNVKVSEVVEQFATKHEKEQGFDLADYLIRYQQSETTLKSDI